MEVGKMEKQKGSEKKNSFQTTCSVLEEEDENFIEKNLQEKKWASAAAWLYVTLFLSLISSF